MPVEDAVAPNRPVAGVLWMLVTGFLFVMVTVIVKAHGQRLPAAESAFLRYGIGLAFLIPLIRPLMRARPTGRQMALFTVRGFLHSIGVMMWFFAMTQIPLAEVTALSYQSPVFVSIGAVLFLGERIALRRILAIIAAMAGALLILRPGFREIEPGHYAMMLNAVLFAMSYLIAKHLSDQASPMVLVAMLSLFVTLGLAPFAIAVWVPPTWEEIGWMALLAVIANTGHYTMMLAFRAAPMTVTQPVTFLQLVWAVVLGALLFSEPADIWVIAGGTLIMGAVSFITWREAVLRRRNRTPPAVATKV
jgi:drug/metabolite transporter (DMT)-like permease